LIGVFKERYILARRVIMFPGYPTLCLSFSGRKKCTEHFEYVYFVHVKFQRKHLDMRILTEFPLDSR
jgi:hypothetical protein